MRLVWVVIPLVLIGIIGTVVLVETEFTYLPKTEIPETSAIFEVDAGIDGTFDVEYTINGGTVNDIIKDIEGSALIVSIESTRDGSITLNFPRELMDAKSQDDTFIVLINGIETFYQEATVSSEFREITIDFKPGDLELEIISPYYP